MSGFDLPAGDVFAALLGPTTIEDFFARSFERAPLHVARADASHFGALFSIADVEELLHVAAAHEHHVLLVNDGVAVAPIDYTIAVRPIGSRTVARPPARAIDPRLVLAHFDRGCTIVINDASALSATLRSLCTRLQTQLGFFSLANVYLSPAGARGFDVHSDTHGTIVLQIEGRKVWRIYEPIVALPIAAQTGALNPRRDNLQFIRDVTLEPGDSLYLPQGVPHEALAEERSLHVTLAMRPPRIADLAEILVELAVAGDVALRRALPAGWQTSPDVLAGVLTDMRERLAGALTIERANVARELLLGDVSRATPATARGMFDTLRDVESLAPETLLHARADAPFTLRQAGDNVVLMAGDRTFSLPATCAPLLDRFVAGGLAVRDAVAVLGEADARDLVKLLALLGLIAR